MQKTLPTTLLVALLGAGATAAPLALPPAGNEPLIVFATPGALGTVTDNLSQHYTIEIVPDPDPFAPIPADLRGAVISPMDLDVPETRAWLAAIFQEGQTAAIVDCLPDEAERMGLAVRFKTRVQLPPATRSMQIVALRRDQDGDQLLYRSHVLHARDTDEAGLPEGISQARRIEIAWLSSYFRPQRVPGIPGDTPEQNLTQLADSVLSTASKTDNNGNGLQLINNIWAARSFLSSSQFDYYYVEQQIVNTAGENRGPGTIQVFSNANNTLTDPTTSSACQLIVADFSPGTTQNATTYTSSVGFSLGGSAGFLSGPIFSVVPSMNITNSKTMTVPETQIAYLTDPATAFTQWQYMTLDGHDLSNTTFGFTHHFIWAVPFCAYDQSQTAIQFLSHASSGYIGNGQELDFDHNSSMPLPFNSTSLGPPSVSSVNATQASPGDEITITGENYYLIDSLTIGGNELPTGTYSVTAGTSQLTMIVPANQPSGRTQSIIVLTDEGISNSDVTIHID